MIKYYCDRCGVEIKKGLNKPTKYSYLVLKTPIVPIFHADPFDYADDFEDEEKSERFHLCDCCTNLLDDFFNEKTIKGKDNKGNRTKYIKWPTSVGWGPEDEKEYTKDDSNAFDAGVLYCMDKLSEQVKEGEIIDLDTN